MRKYIALLTTALLFFSCSNKENAPDAPARPSLLGKWQLTQLTAHRVWNGIAQDTVYYTSETDARRQYLLFKPDSTLWYEEYDETGALTDSGTDTWEYSDNTLILNGRSDTQVVTLTFEDLVFRSIYAREDYDEYTYCRIKQQTE